MKKLTASLAKILVRKNMDEQGINDSRMLPDGLAAPGEYDDRDSDDLDMMIARTLPESINAVHAAAPVEILDGIRLTDEQIATLDLELSGGVLSFTIKEDVNRIVAFRASDSSYVLTEVTTEDSTEGRMQHNPYTRACSLNPRLVVMQGKSADKETSFRYYTVDEAYDQAADAIKILEYIPVYSIDPGQDSAETSYDVAENVLQYIIDDLTGRILLLDGQTDKAQVFLARASFSQPAQQ